MRTESTTSIDGSRPAIRRWANTHPTTRPIATPPAAVITNSLTTPDADRVVAPTAPIAILYAVRPVPSLTSASPSSTVSICGGAPTRRMIAVAETGSVGPSTAPRMNAATHGSPADQCATAATATTVTSTSPIASTEIGTTLARSSYADARNAAA